MGRGAGTGRKSNGSHCRNAPRARGRSARIKLGPRWSKRLAAIRPDLSMTPTSAGSVFPVSISTSCADDTFQNGLVDRNAEGQLHEMRRAPFVIHR